MIGDNSIMGQVKMNPILQFLPFFLSGGLGLTHFETPYTDSFLLCNTFMEKFISLLFLGHVDFTKRNFIFIASIIKVEVYCSWLYVIDKFDSIEFILFIYNSNIYNGSLMVCLKFTKSERYRTD